MRTTDRMLWLAGVLGLAVACGPRPAPTIAIDLSATTARVKAGRFVTVTVTGTHGDKPALIDGTEIDLDTTDGHWLDEQGDQAATVFVEGGRAEARLYSPSSPAEATITASYFDPFTQRVVRTTVEMRWTVPLPTRLEFSCASKTALILDHSSPMRIKCTVSIEDDEGNAVPSAIPRFRAEAGQMERDDDGNWVYNPRVGSRQEPIDLDPLGDATSGEPRWYDGANNRTRNPRDGLATIIVWVEAEDGVDGEPFVDIDDDGEFTAREEPFYEDINKNGRRDEDYTGVLWRSVKIMWGGVLQDIGGAGLAALTPLGETTLRERACVSIDVLALDKNLNALAANDPADTIDYLVESNGDIVVAGLGSGSGFVIGQDNYGIDLDSRGRIRNPSSRSTYLRGATQRVSVCNNAEPGQGSNGFWSLFFAPSRHAFRNESGVADGQGIVGEVGVSGPRWAFTGTAP